MISNQISPSPSYFSVLKDLPNGSRFKYITSSETISDEMQNFAEDGKLDEKEIVLLQIIWKDFHDIYLEAQQN